MLSSFLTKPIYGRDLNVDIYTRIDDPWLSLAHMRVLGRS